MIEFLPLLLQGASALSAMKTAGKGYQPTAAEIAQNQAMANVDRLSKASLNPNDVVFKNLEGQEAQSLRNTTQMGIRDLINADRRARLMGHPSFFNPDRRDESISRYLQNQALEQEPMARNNALQRIMNAISGYKTSASGYSGMIPLQREAKNINNARTSTMFGMGADALQSGGSLSNILSKLGMGGGGMQDIGTAMPWLGGAA